MWKDKVFRLTFYWAEVGVKLSERKHSESRFGHTAAGRSATGKYGPFHKVFSMGKRSRQRKATGYEEVPLVDSRLSAEDLRP